MTSCAITSAPAHDDPDSRAVAVSTTPPGGAKTACLWHVVPTPHLAPRGEYAVLNDLSVVSDMEVWAIGSRYVPQEGGPQRSIVLRWDGSDWTDIPTPGFRARDILLGIAAQSASDVWAVGYSNNSGLTAHWDGTGWTRVPAADPGTRFWHFNAVAALGPDDAWAVGNTATGHSGGTLVEHWDGSRWSVIPGPSVAPDPIINLPYASLESVTVAPGGQLWAVGDALNVGGGPSNTLVERWDGENWMVLPSPDVPKRNGLTFSHLFRVAAFSSTEAWAVGSFGRGAGIGGGGDHALIERWDGMDWALSAVWTREPSRLSSVAAGALGEAWAVGSIGVQGGSRALIRHWTGQQWMPVENPAPRGASLSDVAVTPTGEVWAVGWVSDHASQQALSMRCTVAR